MANFQNAFQAIDETIADCCLRELPWHLINDLWKPDLNDNTRQRITEVYRVGRPLILKILKTDKSPLKNKKKLSICKSMMKAGHDKMESRSPYEALNAFNKAVMFAPHQEDHLSRAVSDRAACLLEIGDPALALRDIEQALAIDDYPFEKLFELEERRGHCFFGMKQYENARTSFTKAISLLEDAAGFLHKRFVERKMAELHSGLKASLQLRDELNRDSASSKCLSMQNLPKLRGSNAGYPALSDKVNVFVNQKKGHDIFANSEICAGDIIGVEKPLVSFLEKDFVKSNCWNCLVTMKAPYACPLCSAVKFCSKSCLDQALSTYHPSECLLTDLLLSNKVGSCVLAFRAVSSKPLQHHLSNRSIINNNINLDDINKLLSHPFPKSSITEDDIKKKTVMTVFYLIILQMTGYFDIKDNDTGGIPPSLSSIYQMTGKENDASLSEHELHIATLIDQIIEITPFCTTEVCHYEMGAEGNDWTTGKVTPVLGKTINTMLSLVKHSCYPTAARVCYENKTLLVAQKNIQPGEAVSLNYSAPFYAAPRVERRKFLYSGYVLNCECDACRQDWPLFDSLPPGPTNLLEPENSPVDNLSEALSQNSMKPSIYNNRPVVRQELNVVDTFNQVRGKIQKLQQVRTTDCPPSKVMIQTQVRLFRCLLAMYSSKMYMVKTGYGSLPIPV